MDLLACLPVALRAPTTTITAMAAGQSGAGVYLDAAGDQRCVLKIASADQPADDWQRQLEVCRLAGDAGVAPAVLHADEARRAVVSEHIRDRGFAGYCAQPNTRGHAMELLGRTLQRVHALPAPAGASVAPRAALAERWAQLAGFARPAIVDATVRAVLAAPAPASMRVPGLSHNDVNPTNLAFDGERLLLLDWDTAGVNDPLWDLATAAMFLRMEDDACQQLLAAHDGAAVTELPACFRDARRVCAALCGTTFLMLARESGHAGNSDAALPTLADCYLRMRTGALSPATGDGRFLLGLALVNEANALA